MSNVLGNLFGEIANAIRAKTGGTDTMKPAEFPTQIAAIPTGGGTSGEIKYASGKFKATENIQTVSHKLGYVPDILIVSTAMSPDNGTLFFAVGFSQAMLDALGGGYKCFVKSVSTAGAASASSNVGMESANPPNGGTYGIIRAVTDTSFTVGGSSFKLKTTGFTDSDDSAYGMYEWFAISGITG